MKELKQDRKSKYTRRALRESLVELMKEKAITKITITELCDKADINRTTFYTHYRDQYDLLLSIEKETVSYFEEVLNRYTNRRSRRDITAMVEEMLTYIANNSNSIQVLLSENGDIVFQKKLFRYFTTGEQVMRYFADRTANKKAREYYSVFVVHGTMGLVQHWLKNGMNISVVDLARMIISLSPAGPLPGGPAV